MDSTLFLAITFPGLYFLLIILSITRIYYKYLIRYFNSVLCNSIDISVKSFLVNIL